MREKESRRRKSSLFFSNFIVFSVVVLAMCFSCSLALAADITPPSAPSNLIAVQGSGTTIDLSWTAASDPESGIDHYIVYRYSAAIDSGNKSHADILNNAVTGITYNDSVGIPGEEYYYAVTAVNGDNLEGALSNSPSQTVPAGPNPHQNYSDTSNFCRDCHRTHGAPSGANILLRKSPEINTCYVCHDGTGSVYNIQVTYQGQSAHDTQISAPAISNIKCMNCHYPHGTGNDFMTRQSEESVCFNSGCHDNATHTRTTTILGWNIYNQFQLSSYHAVSGTTGDGLTGAKIECSSCHGPHTVKYSSTSLEKISNPDNTYNLANATGTGITTLTDFCLKCHDSAPPTQTWGSSVTFVPYSITFPVVTSYPFFTGWNKSAYTSSGHYTTSGTKAYCNNCHHPHGSNNERLTAYNYNNTSTYEEQKLCYACHGTTPASGTKDIQTQATKAYRHPVGDYTGRHSDTEGPSGLDSSNRHAECVDCHDPHYARNGIRSSPSNSYISASLLGVYGVEPTWPSAWTNFTSRSQFTVTRLTNTSSNYEYQLCLKCHSYYAYTSSPPTSPSGGFTETDQAKEFNPNNASYHAVAGASKASSYGGYQSGWTYTTRMACTDCHNTNETISSTVPSGPHGSSNSSKFILKSGKWDVSVTPANYTSPASLCYRCHNLSTNTGFKGGPMGSNLHFSGKGSGTWHRNAPCMTCHAAIPHGGQRRHMIVYVADGSPYYQGTGIGITSYTPHDSQNYWKNDCSTTGGCH